MIFNPGLAPQASGGGGAVTGTYTGDGATTKTLTFDFEPALVIIHCFKYNIFYETIMIYGETQVAVTKKAAGAFDQHQINVSWNGKTIVISPTASRNLIGFNSADTPYYYTAIPKA